MNFALLHGTVCLAVIAASLTGCKEDPEFAKAAASMTQANAVIYDLAGNNSQKLKTRFSDQASADDTIKQLTEEWAGFVRDLGAFKEISRVGTNYAGGLTTVTAHCEFEKGAVLAVIGLEETDKVQIVIVERVAQ